MRRGPVLPLLPLLPLLGCELTEVTVPVGQPRLIVHAVLSRGAERQFVLVERSIRGNAPVLENPDSIPPGGPPQPVTGAVVVLEYPAGTACGPGTDTLPALSEANGVYQAEHLCVPAPSDVVRLRVETPDGEVVSGSTTVPGARRVFAAVGAAEVTTPLAELVLNRDHDTLRVGADPIVARAMQVEIRRPPRVTLTAAEVAQDELVFNFLGDSAGVALPGDLINPFDGDEGMVILRAGTSYSVMLALTDTNYYDFARSFSDPFTGRGFINRLSGGIGVFGSVEAWTFQVRVVADLRDPREGVYRLTGMLDTAAVDVTLELYLDPIATETFAAHLTGRWYGGTVRVSIDGAFLGGPYIADPDPQRFNADLELPVAGRGRAETWVMGGRRAAGGSPFPVRVSGPSRTGLGPVGGTLTAVQVSGPAR